MKCPAEVYQPSPRPYTGLPDLAYPFHDRTIHVTCCGRICLHRKKINLSTVFAGQAVGLKEVEEGIWPVSFMDYDLGYIDLEERNSSLWPILLVQKCYLCIGTLCYPCVRAGHRTRWRRGWDSNPRLSFPNTRFPSVLLKPLGHLSGLIRYEA